MTTDGPRSGSFARRRVLSHSAGVVVTVSGAAIAAGMATSWGQMVLPAELAPLSNSAGAWSVLTLVLVLWTRSRPARGAALGVIAFYLLLVGYALASAMRGLTYSVSPSNIWVIAALLAGPVVGVSAVWLRSQDRRLVAVATAVVSGILIGEGLHGLTRLAASTSPLYWYGSIAVGLAFLGWTVARRLLSPVPIAVPLALCLLVSGGLRVVYGAF